MEIGFTGTQLGMSFAQKRAVRRILFEIDPNKVHHGMCVGADKEFHDIARGMGLYIVGHPGVTKTGKPWNRAECDVDEIEPELPYLDRNLEIARDCHLLLATPKEYEEELRSGTWSTIRRARKLERMLIIIYPNGTMWEERT